MGEHKGELAAAAVGAAGGQHDGDAGEDVVAPPTQVAVKYSAAMDRVMEVSQTKESEDIAKHSRGSHLITVEELEWDLTLEYGQCRVRRGNRVKEIKKQIAANRPRVPVPILVWDAGMLSASCGA